MKVINTIVAIVASKNVYTAPMHHSCMAIAWAWWLRAAIRVQFAPIVRRKVEAKEVVPAICAIVAPKDVKIVVQGDRGM